LKLYMQMLTIVTVLMLFGVLMMLMTIIELYLSHRTVTLFALLFWSTTTIRSSHFFNESLSTKGVEFTNMYTKNLTY